jgi:formylglycine-generating enzyme required for sulfatase activity
MHGNVWEWCQDDWHNNYSNAPKDGSGWTSQSGNTKVLRGGSWGNIPVYCRSAYRTYNALAYHYFNIGFRVVVVRRGLSSPLHSRAFALCSSWLYH